MGIQSYKLQLRIKELQKLVEDELEEFDTKRKVKSNLIKATATKTEIVNIVKGIEFKTEIQINQLQEEDLHIQETQCKEITSEVDSVTADTSTHLLHVNEEVTDTITPEENTEYQA